MSVAFAATREDGLKRFQDFLPRAGAAYAKDRNFDRGPGERGNVSGLSPYLRHRLVSEEEVVRRVIARHHIGGAAKFVEEVCWRTYWKGWLEQRPSVWFDYLNATAADLRRLADEPDLAARYAAAIAGRTGIDAFDAWAGELIDTGYLHNHARMWFASIWIFTLELPWTLGADFFYRHLLDGDPASNTLSWRWVAGLHTEGKVYAATAENIRRFTDGRFDPRGQLNETPDPLPVTAVPPPPTRLRPLMSLAPGRPVVLLLTEDDLTPEQWPLPADSVKGIIALPVSAGNLSPQVAQFRNDALAGALTRAQTHFGVPGIWADALDLTAPRDGAWPGAGTIETLVTTVVPVGPARVAVDQFVERLAGSGLSVLEIRRDWDSAFWPYARAGFFKLKERIPETLEKLGLV